MFERHAQMFVVLLLGAGLFGCMATASVTPGGPNVGGQQAGSTQVAGQGKAPTGVQVTTDGLVFTVGNAKDLMASVTYADGTVDGNVSWSSADDTIVSVNPTTGKVSGIKAGVATIVAASTVDPSKKALVKVTVRSAGVEEAITRVMPPEATVKVGDTTRLDATIQMSDGSISPNVTWTSDNRGVAMVSNGLVTGIAAGETMVTAVAAGDSTKKASAKVVVTAK